MENYIGKICPYCQGKINEGDAVKVCPACDIPHHQECWDENKGCTTFGCAEQHYEAQGTNPTDVCANCGAALGDGQNFCPKCGTPKGVVKPFCNQCGTELQPDQAFCPNCGHKADLMLNAGVASAINQFNANITNTKKKKHWIPITIAIVASVAVLCGGGFYGIRTLRKEQLHDKLQSTEWWSYDDSTKLYLDFSEDEIEYSGYFGTYLGRQEIATLDYEVIDGDTIEVHGQEIEVKIREDSIVFYPSFVNGESYSLWME